MCTVFECKTLSRATLTFCMLCRCGRQGKQASRCNNDVPLILCYSTGTPAIAMIWTHTITQIVKFPHDLQFKQSHWCLTQHSVYGSLPPYIFLPQTLTLVLFCLQTSVSPAEAWTWAWSTRCLPEECARAVRYVGIVIWAISKPADFPQSITRAAVHLRLSILLTSNRDFFLLKAICFI